MTTSLSLADVIREAMNARIADVHVALPASVLRYDSATQTVDVQPTVKDAVPDEDGVLQPRAFPTLPAVPVVWPRAGGFFLTMPIAPGDTGLLVFSELPIDRWRSTGQESGAVNARRHGLGNAVFYPGLSPAGKALSVPAVGDHLALGAEGGAQVHVTPALVNLGEESAADFVALAALVKAEFATLKTALLAAFNAVGAGGAANGATGASSLASGYTPGEVAASKVKAT